MISAMTLRRGALRSLLAVAAVGLVPAGVAAAGHATTSEAALPAGTEAAAQTAVLFDDFDYTTHTDPRLRERGWTVRSYGGGPGVGGDTWAPENVGFVDGDGGRVLRLEATTDGTEAGTAQAEILHQRKFHHGTYAARVRFTDTPVSGPDGDELVQAFFTITPLRFPDDPEYGELDFEYLPNGGWGQADSALFLTSWETYDPAGDARNESTAVPGGQAGWHDLVVQADGTSLRYHVDGRLVAEHSGDVYPDTPMAIHFNQWFIETGFLDSPVSRTWEQQVDWVYHAKDEIVSPDEVLAEVAGYRGAGVGHVDTVPAP
ncbi:Endo-1,3-1,4-beta-glycanase ExoK precursor [Actinoalloteichus hoggarensis]|uniref:Endo-1,3-1,4-beta-glycanase ExoK n=2 Tax=Actinoalloteichus hoggarensis TaxID=1470176 RepID=A0A221W8F3_9PSEU|nr:Endo-1,3-1,4-beta-glycanase ExoK precursor [Actinoalloteichus hoggarensis]